MIRAALAMLVAVFAPACSFPEPVVPGEVATWAFAPDQEIGPATTEFVAMVTERECASGQSSAGRIVGPMVDAYDAAVVVTFEVRPLGGSPGVPGQPADPRHRPAGPGPRRPAASRRWARTAGRATGVRESRILRLGDPIVSIGRIPGPTRPVARRSRETHRLPVVRSLVRLALLAGALRRRTRCSSRSSLPSRPRSSAPTAPTSASTTSPGSWRPRSRCWRPSARGRAGSRSAPA